MTPDVTWHAGGVARSDRPTLGATVWFTGLSGSGKSTLAHTVEEQLFGRACRTIVFDGDNVRHGLCADLGFSLEERAENIRRIGEMSRLFLEAGIIALTAFISPFRKDRERVRNLVGAESFIEIYCDCPLEICEQRDVKGLYKRARRRDQGIYRYLVTLRATGTPRSHTRYRADDAGIVRAEDR